MKRFLIICGNLDGRPTGGVTMHVHRLIKRLVEPEIANYVLCDYKIERIGRQLAKIREADVMHIHASNPYLKLFFVLSGKLFNTKSLITVHGKYGEYGRWKNIIHKLALKWCDVPILINTESYETVRLFNKNAVFIPAFIPPIEDEEVLSPELEKDILTIKSDGKPLFVTNASKRAFMDNGKEIYGIGFLVSFFAIHEEYNLVVFDPNNEYTPLYEDSRLKNVWFYTGRHSFCGLVKLADGVIRNTSTDGDSFSVKEALYFHKPVLASNVVTRPEGTYLFNYNDEESLNNGLVLMLSDHKDISLTEFDAIDGYSALYRELRIINS